MIVAARAGQTLAEKRLRDILNWSDRVAMQHEVIKAPFCRDEPDDVKISRANLSQGLFAHAVADRL
jgi:hypothetical protein